MNNKKLVKPNDVEHLEVLFEIIRLDRAENRPGNSDYVTGPIFQYMLWELSKYLPTATGLRVYYIAGKNEYSYQYSVTECAATALDKMAKRNLPVPISCVTGEDSEQWEGGKI